MVRSGRRESLGGGLLLLAKTTQSMAMSPSAIVGTKRNVQLANVRNFLLRRVREASAASTLDDYYSCVFFPAAVGKPDEYVIGAPGSAAATQNPSLCVNGALLKGKVCQRIREWWAHGERFIADETDDNPVSFSL